jgi:hypothetical protein
MVYGKLLHILRHTLKKSSSHKNELFKLSYEHPLSATCLGTIFIKHPFVLQTFLLFCILIVNIHMKYIKAGALGLSS